MSLPSDVTPDIPPTRDGPRAPGLPPAKSQMTREQQGWVVAALIAFLGVAYVGPAVARYRRKPSLKQRMAYRLRETKRQMRGVGRTARKRVHRLGGGTIWR